MKASANKVIQFYLPNQQDLNNYKLNSYRIFDYVMSCFVFLMMMLVLLTGKLNAQTAKTTGKVLFESYEDLDPVKIKNVTSSHGPYACRLIKITTSATPATGENIFVRYSMNNYKTSEIVQATGSGMNWTATIFAVVGRLTNNITLLES